MKGIDTLLPGTTTICGGRNEFPDVKGIDTCSSRQERETGARRNEFPDVKGIDTHQKLLHRLKVLLVEMSSPT